MRIAFPFSGSFVVLGVSLFSLSAAIPYQLFEHFWGIGMGQKLLHRIKRTEMASGWSVSRDTGRIFGHRTHVNPLQPFNLVCWKHLSINEQSHRTTDMCPVRRKCLHSSPVTKSMLVFFAVRFGHKIGGIPHEGVSSPFNK